MNITIQSPKPSWLTQYVEDEDLIQELLADKTIELPTQRFTTERMNTSGSSRTTRLINPLSHPCQQW